MKKISTLLFLLISIQLSAQQSQFSRIYYDLASAHTAYSQVNSYDGGLMVVGTYAYTSAIFKVDSAGNFLWGKSLMASGNEVYNSIIRTNDSCFVVAGKSYDAGSSDLN